MKKIGICLSIILIVCSIFIMGNTVYAEENSIIDSETAGQLVQIKEKESRELSDYVETYGSESYGFVAYVLGKVRIYSIPLCFLGIAVGAIYQYVIGIRKLDVRDKGFNLVIMFVTLLVICQILPLVFTIVVKGWRN